jgi:citrate synthase
MMVMMGFGYRLYPSYDGRVNLFLYLTERFKDFWVFAQEMWYDSTSGKIQCLKRLQIK